MGYPAPSGQPSGTLVYILSMWILVSVLGILLAGVLVRLVILVFWSLIR
jgi:hypothetical protein